MTRRERFIEVMEWYGMKATDYDPGEEEDPSEYVSGERECERYACVTVNYSSHGEAKHFFLLFEDKNVAMARACDYAQDDLFEELPVAVYDLDSRAVWEPDFETVQWKEVAVHGATE